jgi:hypothetical protein
MDCSVLNTSSSAPVTDCSVLDTWRFVPTADISALLTLRPALVTDAAVFSTLEFCVAPVVHRARHLSLRPVYELLRLRHLALICFLRIAPHADTLRPSCCAWIAPCSTLQAPHRSQIALCSILDALFRPRISPRSSLCARRWSRMPPCSTLWSFASRPSYTALDTCHSAPYTDYSVYDTWLLFVSCGLLRTHHLVPCVSRGLLRAQHLVLRAGTCRPPHFAVRAVRELLRARPLASSASRRLLCAPHRLPRAGHRFDSVLDT